LKILIDQRGDDLQRYAREEPGCGVAHKEEQGFHVGENSMMSCVSEDCSEGTGLPYQWFLRLGFPIASGYLFFNC